MSNYDKNVHQNPDAKAWAEFFLQTLKDRNWSIDNIDEDLMTGWFANAMMAMHDYIYAKKLVEHDAQVIENWLKQIPNSNRSVCLSVVRQSAQSYANQLRQKAKENQ